MTSRGLASLNKNAEIVYWRELECSFKEVGNKVGITRQAARSAYVKWKDNPMIAKAVAMRMEEPDGDETI